MADTQIITADELEEGMEVLSPGGEAVIVEAVENDPRKPYITFEAFNGRRFLVSKAETFTKLS